MLKQGKVVLTMGARQAGKTAMLKGHLGGSINYVAMEEPAAYAQTQSDAVPFFQSHELPIIIDEVQRVPELFSPIKWIVE